MRPSLDTRCLASLAVMLASVLLGALLVPSHHLAAAGQTLDLEHLVPRGFGGWEMDSRARATLVNPQERDLESRLYQQVLSRTYVHGPTGRQVMLSVAYGENQTR